MLRFSSNKSGLALRFGNGWLEALNNTSGQERRLISTNASAAMINKYGLNSSTRISLESHNVESLDALKTVLGDSFQMANGSIPVVAKSKRLCASGFEINKQRRTSIRYDASRNTGSTRNVWKNSVYEFKCLMGDSQPTVVSTRLTACRPYSSLTPSPPSTSSISQSLPLLTPQNSKPIQDYTQLNDAAYATSISHEAEEDNAEKLALKQSTISETQISRSLKINFSLFLYKLLVCSCDDEL